MIEMWRVWKKRKSRLRNGLAPARHAAGKASQNLAKVGFCALIITGKHIEEHESEEFSNQSHRKRYELHRVSSKRLIGPPLSVVPT